MTVVITTGPAWEPVDGMRRLTNASTGALGTTLTAAFARRGHRVLLFRGSMATAPRPAPSMAAVEAFDTNDDLARRLEILSRAEPVHAVLHAAALCDYRVARVLDDAGRARTEAKVPTAAGRLVLELEPAPKVLPRLRAWFPEAWICGWKYELDGSREDALAAAWRQIAGASTHACVVNGRAWGDGFGLCEPPDGVAACADAEALAARLVAVIGV